MNLEVIIEKVDDDISIPLGETDALQVRSDGIMLNGELHFWEEIISVMITNRDVLNKIKEESEE